MWVGAGICGFRWLYGVNVGQPNPLRWKNSGAVWRSLAQFGAVWRNLARFAEWTPGQWNDEKKLWFGLVRIGSE